MYMIIDMSKYECVRKCIYHTAIFEKDELEAYKKACKSACFIYKINGLIRIDEIESAYRLSKS
jgi:hypothetical protein